MQTSSVTKSPAKFVGGILPPDKNRTSPDHHLNHHLDVQKYSFQEILALFHLDKCAKITAEDMKRAKTIVLRMHPDKSQLSPEYFLFYKRALDVVADFYQEQIRTQQTVPQTNPVYVPQGKGISIGGVQDETNEVIQKAIPKMESKEFQKTFNRLFDENMLNKEKQKQDQERNQWFSQDNPIENLELRGDVHHKIEQIKQAQQTQQMTKYRGVQMLNMSGVAVGELYENDSDNSHYLTTDPFSKLKYDDLRKVHKDQTIFSVSESDINKIPQFNSVDHLKRERGSQNMTPLGKKEASQLLDNQQQQHKEQLLRHEYNTKLQTMQYEEKNKQVLSHFLLLKS